MSKKRTLATDIRNPERYFAKWLSCEKKNFHKKQNKIDIFNESLEEITETQSGDAMLAVNKNGELFAESETKMPEFAWMELFKNERLYEVVCALSDEDKLFLTLKFANRMTAKEIAAETSLSIRTVENNIFRLIEKLRKLF